MGRPRRRTGHLAGTFPPPTIRSSQHQVQRRLSSSQPPHTQSSLPQSTYPFRPSNPTPEILQRGAFPVVEPTYTPSTTETVSPISRRATLSPSASSVASGYTVALEHVRHMSPGAHTPTSSTGSVPKRQRLHHSDHANKQVLYTTAPRDDYLPTPGFPMTGKSTNIVLLASTPAHLSRGLGGYRQRCLVARTASSPLSKSPMLYATRAFPDKTSEIPCHDRVMECPPLPPRGTKFRRRRQPACRDGDCSRIPPLLSRTRKGRRKDRTPQSRAKTTSQ